MTHLVKRVATHISTYWRVDAIVLDSRFGVRMLIKHRGLTVVGAFAMAVAIAVGATLFEVFSELLDPALPFAGGERVVSLHFVGSDPGSPERQVLHDFAALRGQLVTIEHFGAFRNAQHNLVAADTAPELVLVAEITASAFALSGTPALLGRCLLPADEPKSATPVVVIGHESWQVRFGGDRKVVGRTINLGGVPRTVVGVMPEGFKFPVDHEFWVPLREDPLEWAIMLVTGSVLLLSAAGIYALMSFTVAQRTREIGIRTALGAQPGRVMLNVFGRAAWQVAAGVLVGSILSGAAFVAIGLGLASAAPLLLAVAAIMGFVGLIAAFGPARRAVRIQAIEALRADV